MLGAYVKRRFHIPLIPLTVRPVSRGDTHLSIPGVLVPVIEIFITYMHVYKICISLRSNIQVTHVNAHKHQIRQINI